jgi:nucleoside-diphosphate-sugar epimerase
MINKLAVIGATGMLGKPVTLELLKAGFRITALSRNPDKAKTKFPEGIRWIKGDIKNPNDLTELLNGQDGLYVNLNLKQGERKNDFHSETDGLKNLLSSAKANQIKHIGFISSIVMNYQGMNGFHWWVFDMKREAVEMIKASGVPYTIFYPSAFMENFFTNYRKGNKVLLAGKAIQKMYFISAIDFGKQVGKAFQTGATNKEYFIQGLEGFTADEAAEVFVKYYTKEKLAISRAPLGLLQFFGKFSPTMNYVSHIIEALNNYPEPPPDRKTWDDLGRPQITLRAFAEGKVDNLGQ